MQHVEPSRQRCGLLSCRVIAETGVQFISCGALTHSVTALDISLNIETK
jgi:nicotinate-nucleotide pyrophosphorylase (carboxylating)